MLLLVSKGAIIVIRYTNLKSGAATGKRLIHFGLGTLFVAAVLICHPHIRSG